MEVIIVLIHKAEAQEGYGIAECLWITLVVKLGT